MINLMTVLHWSFWRIVGLKFSPACNGYGES